MLVIPQKITANESGSLLACPFCAGEGVITSQPHDDMDRQYFVRCRACATEGPWTKNENGAKVLWNKRAGIARQRSKRGDMLKFAKNATVKRYLRKYIL